VSHHGQHEAIIDMTTWNAVQAQLASNTQGPRSGDVGLLLALRCWQAN